VKLFAFLSSCLPGRCGCANHLRVQVPGHFFVCPLLARRYGGFFSIGVVKLIFEGGKVAREENLMRPASLVPVLFDESI